MLMRTHDLAAQQLLEDLQSVRARLESGWLKRGFRDRDGNVCIMAAINQTLGLPVSSFNPAYNPDKPVEQRLGRLVYQIYTTLYGPGADTTVTVSRAGSLIAGFNDSKIVTKEAVLLLIDRAIAEIVTPGAA
jgi:hypothetical protein